MNIAKSLRIRLGMSMGEAGKALFGYDNQQGRSTWVKWEANEESLNIPTRKYLELIHALLDASENNMPGCDEAIGLAFKVDAYNPVPLTRITEKQCPDSDEHYPDPTYLTGLIKSAGLTNQDAAKTIGIDKRTLSRYLSTASTNKAPYTVQFSLECLADYKKTKKND